MTAGIPYSRIVLGGFSQGGAMSYFTGYQMIKALAGVLVLSGYIPKMQVRQWQLTVENASLYHSFLTWIVVSLGVCGEPRGEERAGADLPR